MFSSFFQYLCLAPSFTNVLNVYAFCNLHDVSWGTKGSDKAEALPSVSSSKTKGAETIVEDTAKVQEDVDASFKETVTRAITKIEVKEVPEKPTMDDQNKTFRTRLVSFWMLSNAGLAVAIENINGLQTTTNAVAQETALRSKQNIYFAVILYSTFALALVRFTGVSYFITLSALAAIDAVLPVLVLLLQTQSVQMVSEELIPLTISTARYIRFS
jgi:chitin synthase